MNWENLPEDYLIYLNSILDGTETDFSEADLKDAQLWEQESQLLTNEDLLKLAPQE